MPLIDPVTTSSSGDVLQQWQQKLMGKTLGNTSDSTTFDKKELPQNHRVLQPDSMATMDHQPDRLSVHVAEDGTVRKVTHG